MSGRRRRQSCVRGPSRLLRAVRRSRSDRRRGRVARPGRVPRARDRRQQKRDVPQARITEGVGRRPNRGRAAAATRRHRTPAPAPRASRRSGASGEQANRKGALQQRRGDRVARGEARRHRRCQHRKKQRRLGRQPATGGRASPLGANASESERRPRATRWKARGRNEPWQDDVPPRRRCGRPASWPGRGAALCRASCRHGASAKRRANQNSMTAPTTARKFLGGSRERRAAEAALPPQGLANQGEFFPSHRRAEKWSGR